MHAPDPINALNGHDPRMPKPVNANPMNVNALMQHPLSMFAHPPSLMQFFGRHDPRMPVAQSGPVQANPGTQGPQVPNTQFPLNPGAGGPIQGQQYPMVGSSYNVLGMHPATSPFGLPTY